MIFLGIVSVYLIARCGAQAGLKLEFVYGYAGKDNTAPNLFWTADNKLVYYIAALGVVYDPDTHTQSFFQVWRTATRRIAET
jgi:hypothetical protein